MNQQRFVHFDANTQGRDFVIGDIQGYFRRVEEALKQVNFNPKKDRLFCTGDLVNRGPESAEVLDWLERPGIYSVGGNHEDLAVAYGLGQWHDTQDFQQCGGQWMIDMAPKERRRYAERLAELPYAIEVETPRGLVGVIHSDVYADDWARMREELQSSKHDKEIRGVIHTAIWKREKITTLNEATIANITTVFSGHTTVKLPKLLGNVMFIDTAGWTDHGYFAIVNMHNLQASTPKPPRLER